MVSKEKVDLLTEIILNQKDFLTSNDKEIDLYVNIPFCVSRCTYCSFISALVKTSENLIEPYVEALIKEIEEEDTKIVKRKKIEVKPMDEEEAILQMELLGHEFYLFNDIETDKPTVIYKRKDGNYGIIETE